MMGPTNSLYNSLAKVNKEHLLSSLFFNKKKKSQSVLFKISNFLLFFILNSFIEVPPFGNDNESGEVHELEKTEPQDLQKVIENGT